MSGTLLQQFTCQTCQQDVEGIPYGPLGQEHCAPCWLGRWDGKRLVKPGDTVFLPSEFRCPECDEHLSMTVQEWETRTGIPTDAGVDVGCQREDAEAEEGRSWFGHRRHQSEWQPVVSRVTRWAQENVRVVPDCGRVSR